MKYFPIRQLGVTSQFLDLTGIIGLTSLLNTTRLSNEIALYIRNIDTASKTYNIKFKMATALQSKDSEVTMASAISETKSIISRAKSRPAKFQAAPSVAITLIGFSLAMLVLPLGTYFITIDRVFRG